MSGTVVGARNVLVKMTDTVPAPQSPQAPCSGWGDGVALGTEGSGREAVKLWEETGCGAVSMASQSGEGHLLLGEWIWPCGPGAQGGLSVRRDGMYVHLLTSTAVLWAVSASLAWAKG